MDKENVLVLVKVPLFQQLEEARKGLAGIYRVCQDALRPGQTADRSTAFGAGDGVAGANAVVYANILPRDADVCLQQLLRPGSQFHSNLSERAVTNADANGTGPGQEELSAQSQARICSAGTGGADDSVKGN